MTFDDWQYAIPIAVKYIFNANIILNISMYSKTI